MTAKKARLTFGEGNLESAEIIASDPERYGGIMQEWARRILEQNKPAEEEVPG